MYKALSMLQFIYLVVLTEIVTFNFLTNFICFFLQQNKKLSQVVFLFRKCEHFMHRFFESLNIFRPECLPLQLPLVFLHKSGFLQLFLSLPSVLRNSLARYKRLVGFLPEWFCSAVPIFSGFI